MNQNPEQPIELEFEESGAEQYIRQFQEDLLSEEGKDPSTELLSTLNDQTRETLIALRNHLDDVRVNAVDEAEHERYTKTVEAINRTLDTPKKP